MLSSRFSFGFLQPAKTAMRTSAPARFLNIHEYQGKILMNRFGVNTQYGSHAASESEAKTVAEDVLSKYPGTELVIKAQVHAGGRGKGTFVDGFKSGVHFSFQADEAATLASKMLGNSLVTKQTGEDGQYCSNVLVLKSIDIESEKYFAIVMDRESQCPVMMASPDGGMDIEAVAEATPERIFTEKIDLTKGVQQEQTDRLAVSLGFEGEQAAVASEQMQNLYKMFMDVDATQVEINPMATTPDGEVICVDAKINFDDNAFFRQKEVFGWGDPTQEDPRDVAAEKAGVNYIGLDGNIACMVNGAGLAMATMDIIKMSGGEPANFLDLGGGATEQVVTDAFEILTGDENVQGILVNVFGGIVRCDVIAEGIINAAKAINIQVPLVVRLEGTNSTEGMRLLDESGLDLITAANLDDAAKKIVAAV